MAWPSKDWEDYRDDLPREPWHNRKSAPVTLSTAAGGIGLLAGLTVGWLTDLREAPPAVVGGLVGMLGFDFYWRFVRESLPHRGSRQNVK
ncbi:MAG: hypothetical protein ACRDKI_05065 [Solirubrobacterales bacterium]